MFLNLTHLDGGFLRKRFPKIFETCLRFGLDMSKDLLPVSPAVHYVPGGVRTDTHGRTGLQGLYAAGEMACADVHGAKKVAAAIAAKTSPIETSWENFIWLTLPRSVRPAIFSVERSNQ